MTATTVLEAAPLLHYEFLVGEEDFAISLNGACQLSAFYGYSIDENWCLVLHQQDMETVTAPVPLGMRPLVESVEDLFFWKFEDRKMVDAIELPRVWPANC